MDEIVGLIAKAPYEIWVCLSLKLKAPIVAVKVKIFCYYYYSIFIICCAIFQDSSSTVFNLATASERGTG